MDNKYFFEVVVSLNRSNKTMELDDIEFAELIIESISKMKIGDIVQNNLDKLRISNLFKRFSKDQGDDEIEDIDRQIPVITIETEKLGIQFFIDRCYFRLPIPLSVDKLNTSKDSVEKSVIAILSLLIGSEVLNPDLEYTQRMSIELQDIPLDGLEKYWKIESDRNLKELQIMVSFQSTEETVLTLSTTSFMMGDSRPDVMVSVSMDKKERIENFSLEVQKLHQEIEKVEGELHE